MPLFLPDNLLKKVIGVFKQKNPGNLFVLFILGILLRLPAFFYAYPPIIKPQDSIVYRKFIEFLKPVAFVFPGVYSIIAYLLIFFQAYLLTRFINNNRLMIRANFLPGMAYIIITSFIPEFCILSSPVIVSAFFISVFILLFAAHNDKITRGAIFNAGLMTGLAGLLFFPSWIFLIFAFIVLGVLRPFRMQEWLLLLFGAVAPIYFYGIFLYLNDSLTLGHFYNGVTIDLLIEKFTIWHAIGLFLLLMPLLAGIYSIQSLSGRMLIHVRKAWNLFLIYVAICILIVFFNIGRGFENWVLLLLPLASIQGFGYFNAEWKVYPKIAFWLSILFIVSVQLFSGLW